MPDILSGTKTYLGDGAYAGHDGYQIWVWASDGVRDYNHVALDRGTFSALMEFGRKVYSPPRKKPSSTQLTDAEG